jgi:hypothetical protein
LQTLLHKLKNLKFRPPAGGLENLLIATLLIAFPAFPPATTIIKRMGRPPATLRLFILGPAGAGIRQILTLFFSHYMFFKYL